VAVEQDGPLGRVGLAAVSLYVSDLDAAVAWYRDTLGLEAVAGRDGDDYATFSLSGSIVVLEPRRAAIKPVPDGPGATTINLVVDRDVDDVRSELVGGGVECSDIVPSPGFRSFLVSDPDGNRFYITKPASSA
jgi:lactoylglutathione lyase